MASTWAKKLVDLYRDRRKSAERAPEPPTAVVHESPSPEMRVADIGDKKAERLSRVPAENIETAPLLKELQSQIKEAIVKSFRARGRSVTKEGYMTGNHYQSIRLGDEYVSGFRSTREEVFAGIDFTGRTVLDLGCNFGELSRHASRLGAKSVYGIEYDPFFVKLGNYINLYNDIDNVCIEVGDITKEEFYKRKYDIVFLFSVYKIVAKNISKLCEAVDDTLIVETHSLGADSLQSYINSIAPHFEYYCVYQSSDLTISTDSSERRALVMFSKKNSRWRFLNRRVRELSNGSPFLRSVDIGKSAFGSFLDIQKFPQQFADVLRSSTDIFELGKRCSELSLPWEMDGPDAEKFTPDGSYYWVMFLRGFSEYADSGRVDVQNKYVKWLRLQFSHGRYDPGLGTIMDDDAKISERVRLRFENLKNVSKPGDSDEVDPIVLFNSVSESTSAKDQIDRCITFTDGTRVLPFDIDGYHRIFGAYVGGKPSIPAMCIWDSKCESFFRLAEKYPKLREESLETCLDLTSAKNPSLLAAQ